MVNVLKVAKKEFADLLNSWLVVLVLIIYIILIFHTIENCRNAVSLLSPVTSQRFYNIIGGSLWSLLTYYGMFVGIIIGFASIASERHGGALSLLVAKPLYRDSIINGKLIGTSLFITCIFIVTTVIYFGVSIAVFGDMFIQVLRFFIEDLWIVFLLAIGYVMIFTLLSMLISMLIRNQAFALIATFLLVYVMDIGRGMNVAGFLSYIVAGGDIQFHSAIADLSPLSVVTKVVYCMFPPLSPVSLPDTVNILAGYTLEPIVLQLVLYLVICIVACYITFIRRDIV